LYALIDQRFLGRLRYLNIAKSTEWDKEQDGAEIGALELLLEEVDKETWVERRWHYENIASATVGMPYEIWIDETSLGRSCKPKLKILQFQ
jgi:hypothetical protein